MPDDIVEERKKRRVAVERKIADIAEGDVRVAVVGTVLSIDKQTLVFTIEDPSGQLTVLATNEESLSKVSVGNVVRVIGIVLPFDEGFELRAEIIQDFKDLSPELFPVLHELI